MAHIFVILWQMKLVYHDQLNYNHSPVSYHLQVTSVFREYAYVGIKIIVPNFLVNHCFNEALFYSTYIIIMCFYWLSEYL